MPRPRRSQDTRERLLDEGVRVLIEQGYHGTGIKEIVDRVGVPKGSFYNYFESKEHFGAEVIRRYAAELLGRMDGALKLADEDALEALRRYFRAATELYEQHGTHEGCLLCNLGAEVSGSSALCREAVAEAFNAEQQRLARVLHQGQMAGQIRDDIPAAALAYALIDAWNGALIRMKSEWSVQPLRQFCDLYLERLITA